MGLTEQEQVRSSLIEELEQDLIGPRIYKKGKKSSEGHANTTIEYRNPKNEYVAGVLYPSYTIIDDEDKENDAAGDTDEDDNYDLSSAKDSMFKPSSFGLTCRIENETTKIRAIINYAIYSETKDDEEHSIFTRIPKTENFILDTDIGSHHIKFTNNPNFTLEYKIIRENKYTILDLYVINKTPFSEKQFLYDIMFQSEIILESLDNKKCFLQNKSNVAKRYYPVDDESLEILFSKKTI